MHTQVPAHARRSLRLLILAIPLLLSSACAVQKTATGTQFALDEAELLGVPVHTFRLHDGSEARIRRLGNSYSIKLQRYQRVIPIPGATAVRFISARQVGTATLVVLEKADLGCGLKTQLYAIRGADVSGWDFGDCMASARVSYAGNSAFFDYPGDTRATRFTYQEGRLMRGELPSRASASAPVQTAPVRTPANAPAPLPPDMPRYAPPLPILLGEARSPAPASPTSPASAAPRVAQAPRPPVAKPAPPPAPKADIKFKEQEQKASIVLILDK